MRVGAPRVLGGPSGTPGRVFENLLIVGSNTGERYFSPPGDIRAYDVITGRLVWTFHTIPRPGELGYDTWPKEAWKYAGGANSWGELSVDTTRGIVYVPTGSPTHDVYGGDRKGANLFANTLLALDARTGKRRWHFQMVHHDLWDYDLTAAPKLLTVRHGSRSRDIVAQLTKHGFLFVFDRATGEPLWPIEERPVPKSSVPGEHAWPTQPFPLRPAPFARQSFTREEINPHLGPEEKARVLERFLAAANEGLFTPLALGREQFTMPGQFGGGNWGASAADPTTGMLYVRTIDQPTISELREFDPNEPANQPQSSAREAGLHLFTGKRYTGPLGQAFRTKSGLSAIGPPWSEIVAYDLNEGAIKWRAPFGTSPALAARGVTDTGNARRAWRNGPVVTAGGLIFLGSWADRTVRAFDVRNGKLLWEHPLKANPEGIVSVFEVNGRQYVAFCASGSATEETPIAEAYESLLGLASAQGYYVFALPQTSQMRTP
jgi:glucose dehydrogenase